MNTITKIVLFAAVLISLTTGCIPVKKYEELKTNSDNAKQEMSALKAIKEELESSNNEQQATINKQKKKIVKMQNDTTKSGMAYRELQSQYNKVNLSYENVIDKNADLLAGDKRENRMLLDELDGKERNLQAQEDKLKVLERDLDSKKIALEKTKMDLEEREAKVIELQKILNSKDSIVNALKDKVSKALLGFENNGLTITEKNGKVYVSLDESLLFASGSVNVDPKGVDALKKLAEVLGNNKDVNVLIEGHTDDVPLSGKGKIKDNWDLSVLRATSIVKILLTDSGIDAKRLTPAGRGEFLPLDIADTPEARTKNRRTEIILTPRLDELFEILENN
ncbi:MAG: OmpA family protein [Flavobacteriales bacterium]|nr:OmpA family protein [Flavobacteriales bacterium]